MAVLATAVSVWKGSQVVSLLAGETVPEWAEGLIGDHCLVPEGETPPEAPSEPDSPPAEDSAGEPEAHAAPPEAPSEPDFTKPATKRGPGRPRKQG